MTNEQIIKEIMELLADIEHQRWSDWQKYVHSKCDGGRTIDKECYDRWSRQIETPYLNLTEEEKEKDREQVRRYLPIILQVRMEAYKKGQEDAFNGKIDMLETLTISETVNVIPELQEYFRKQGRTDTINEIRKEVESKKTDTIDCSDFHNLKEGFAWTPCGHCGLRRDEKPKKTKLEIYYDAYNQALEDIKTFLNKLDK